MTTVLSFLAGAAVAFIFMVVGCLVAQWRTGHLLCLRRRRAETTSRPVGQAWSDEERGEGNGFVESAKSGQLTPRLLGVTLRGVLEDEIAKGFHRSGLAERLDRLEKTAHVWLPREEEADLRKAASETLKTSTAETQTPNSSGGSSPRVDDLPGVVPACLPDWKLAPPAPPAPPAPAPPPVPPPDAWGTMEPLPCPSACRLCGCQPLDPSAERKDAAGPKLAERPGHNLEFGPTERQHELEEPPERLLPVEPEQGRQQTLQTLQRILERRDTQTTELHRQLREARKGLWLQTVEARASAARLAELLSDPSRAPAAQAEALAELQKEASELSRQLADARQGEQHWGHVAKRQRAYLMQHERLAHDGARLLRRHPAGEIFLAPPPPALEGEPPSRTWDVGTSHCNPYCVDSWPFEPNVLAQRTHHEPAFQGWEEVDEDEEEESESEEDSHGPGTPAWAQSRSPSGLARLPPLPAPPLGGSETARSL